MNPIDLLVLVLVVGGGFLGWVNGVVKWLFTFLGFVAGVFIASRLYKTLDWAIPMVDSDGLRQFITFALIVVAVSLGAWMLGRAVKMTLSMLMLGWVDRGAGMAVGLLVGLLGASAVGPGSERPTGGRECGRRSRSRSWPTRSWMRRRSCGSSCRRSSR